MVYAAEEHNDVLTVPHPENSSISSYVSGFAGHQLKLDPV